MNKNEGRKGLFHIMFERSTLVILLLLVQIIFFIVCINWINEYFIKFYTICYILGSILVIYIVNTKGNPMYKIAWVIPILVIPVFGALLYIFVRLQLETKLMSARIKKIKRKTKKYLKTDEMIKHELENNNPALNNLANYLEEFAGYPTYKNTKAKYFPSGEAKLEELKLELEKAKKFIFLEYFIVAEGKMWGEILEILKRKVKEGVEVRFMYDGTCTFKLLPFSYPKYMNSLGIKCKMFSPIRPVLSTYQNNRDHRKIVVIDGHTAFTGGINLADEYINEKELFGHWKDTAIMVKGEAVKSFTIMFLQMWDVTEKSEEDYEKYINDIEYENDLHLKEEGYMIPFGDSPMDRENVGELVYMDIINKSTGYVHITTPYLILDNEMITTLKYAAKCGKDIKIIMPHIPDKWYAYWVSRTYYEELIESGVKIYEYTPGFIHAKVFTSDDVKAVVGTINLDYRSLYLHFECANYIQNNEIVKEIEKDFQDTLDKSERITLENCKKFSIYKKIIGRLLRLFAPLL